VAKFANRVATRSADRTWRRYLSDGAEALFQNYRRDGSGGHGGHCSAQGGTRTLPGLSRRLRSRIPHGPFVIVRLLPLVADQPQYRVRSTVDGDERVVTEQQIKRVEPIPNYGEPNRLFEVGGNPTADGSR
jgi:hypothetical protein